MKSNPYQFNVDLDDNVAREIDNPLAHLDDLDQLDEDATQFAYRVSPDAPDVELWKRAARVARDPLGASPETIPGLTLEEDAALKSEQRRRFWRQPKPLRVTIATLCIGAIIQGWTQTGSNGANLSWIIEFGLANGQGIITSNRNNWIFSGVNAITYLAASVFGCWLSDPLQSWLLGRRGAIFVSGLLILASVVGCACSHSWQQLMACRALLGLGMGAKASVVPIMGAEVAPPHLRGALVMNWQLMDALGIFFGFTANLVVANIGPLAWRFQIASAAIPTLCLLSLIWTIPESPRFLLKKGRLRDAYRTLLTLRETPLLAARELYYANAQIQAEVSLLPRKERDTEADGQGTGYKAANEHDEPTQAVRRRGNFKRQVKSGWHYASRYVDESELDPFQRRLKKTTYFTRLWQLFRDRRTRRATLAAFVVMIGQQLCGINVLEFYSSTFFKNVNNNAKPMEALWLSWGLGLANFLFTFPVYYFIDKRGRRFLLLATYPGMILSMLAACLSFLIQDNQSARSGVIAFFIFVFFFFYSWGQGKIDPFRA
jgi:MFS family permease